MNAADKLILIAENMPKVYEAGKKAGGGAGTYESLRYANAVQFRSLNVFGEPEVTIDLGEHITSLATFINLTSSSDMNNVNNTVEHLTVNCSGLPTTMLNFMACSNSRRDEKLTNLTLNVNTREVTAFSAAFAFLFVLEVIGGTPLDFTKTTSAVNPFNYCNELKEVRLQPGTLSISMSFAHCSKLSANSIQSIIDGLATVETAQTITFHKNIALTEDQKETIKGKGWTLVQ